jgi:3-oxoacyl-[acyl-carrier-protein] synthase-3
MATLATATGTPYAAVLGVGSYRPSLIVPNADIVDAIDSSDEWIQQRSGIKQRRFATPEETVQMMSVAASRAALEHAGVAAEQIDCVIVATVTHLLQTPAIATAIAYELGTDQAAAFDISAACAGYCHGISLANDMIRGGSAEYVLVVGVEKLSDFTDWDDRGTAFIFGDGAGAAVIGPSDTPGIGPTIWGSDGAQWQAIMQREPWTDYRRPQVGEGPFDKTVQPRNWPAIGMAGQSVFRWAVWGMAPVAQQAIDKAGISIDDLDAFIPHQANMRIIDAMIKQLKLPADIPVARDIAETANTSAASIPLATERMLRQKEIPSGGLALQIGFGAGLVYAAQVVVIP